MVTVRRNTSEISMKTNHRSIEHAIDATCIYIIYCNMLYILYIFALLYKLYIFVLFSLCDSTIRTQINAPTSAYSAQNEVCPTCISLHCQSKSKPLGDASSILESDSWTDPYYRRAWRARRPPLFGCSFDMNLNSFDPCSYLF